MHAVYWIYLSGSQGSRGLFSATLYRVHISTWDKAVFSIIDLEDSSYCSDCSPACISFCLFPSRLPIVLDYLVYPPSTSMTTE